ncbi:MAG: SAM-dependent methyltransferase [Pseudomonadota bacterium]
MTRLKQELLRQIQRTGPLTIAEYMTQCLLHPDYGYYTQEQPFGRDGDFVTAPETSQIFGEMVGLALAQAWLDQGAPSPFALVELGPGKGTLMADILRVTSQVPGFHKAMQVHLIEASPRLRDVQTETLNGLHLKHHDALTDLPELPLFLIANEYFDCMPIHQFSRTNDGFKEVMVSADNQDLVLGLGTTQGWSTDQDFVETSPAALSIMLEIDARIARNGGAALIIDYGSIGNGTDTLQSMKGHKLIHPLEAPGDCDLTAHVDFKPLRGVIEQAQASKITEQGVFLERLGITKRAQTLASRLSGDALENHIAAHRRLTHPDEMGSLFKVMGVVPKDATMIAGLASK